MPFYCGPSWCNVDNGVLCEECEDQMSEYTNFFDWWKLQHDVSQLDQDSYLRCWDEAVRVTWQAADDEIQVARKELFELKQKHASLESSFRAQSEDAAVLATRCELLEQNLAELGDKLRELRLTATLDLASRNTRHGR